MMEKNVGGYDRIARGVLATLSTAVGVAGLAALGPLTATVGVLALGASAGLWRSEERRVGKECRL